MHLKAVEIHGFKSFADKTVLSFLPSIGGRQSITAIVGPNGSGKSNISDALRWVMGEQSLKAIRGKKSEDVIFSGSEIKGRMGLASVSMIIDNTDKKLPIEYDELSITRRLYRSGESEYLINGHEARLFDIELLLAKAQFGQGSYSLISQGTIDRLLLQTPAERMEFFDEASGIKELQIKRHHSNLKLERTRIHIDEANLLLSEVAPRLKTLSRQVKKLEERQEIETKLRALQELYYITIWNDGFEQAKKIKAEIELLEAAQLQTKKSLEKIQFELADLSRAVGSDYFKSWQASFASLMAEKSALERERAIVEGKMQTSYSNAGKIELGWMEQRLSDLGARLAVLEREADTAQNLGRASLEAVTRAENELKELEKSCVELDVSILTLETRIKNSESEQNIFQLTGLRAVQSILDNRKMFGSVYGALAQLGSVDKEHRLALEIAAGNNLYSLVVGDDQVAEKCIQYLRNERLGIATFLPLNRMRPRQLSRELDYLLARPGVLGLASDLVKYDAEFAPVFLYVFGTTLIVDTLATARAIGIGEVRMVTLFGDVVDKSGSMKGGYRREKQMSLSFSSRALSSISPSNLDEEVFHLQSLKTELFSARERRESLRTESRIRAAEANMAKEKELLMTAQIREVLKEQAALVQEKNSQELSPEEYEGFLGSLTEKKKTLEVSVGAIIEKELVMQAEMEAWRKEEEDRRQSAFALQGVMQNVQNQLNKLVEEKNTKAVDLAKVETRLEDLNNEVLEELHESIEMVRTRGIPPGSLDEMETLGVQVQKLKYQLSLIGGIDPEVIAEYTQTKERHESLESQLNDLNKAWGDLKNMVGELDAMMKKKRDFAFKKIRAEFSRYFSLLFEGGHADLVEMYEEERDQGDEEEKATVLGGVPPEGGKITKKLPMVLAGIEVLASPPGKKITHIQALSGGERTLTSMALICAILNTNPAPFVLLDEVEAALDEANTVRFTSILCELAKESQFILITHNRATMHVADVLYGVTMNKDGISRLTSVKLEGIELGEVK